MEVLRQLHERKSVRVYEDRPVEQDVKRQILEAAKVSLQCQEESCAAARLRYEQGTISHNALLTAEDELASARETVENAANDLFAAYNTYCWAAGHGILN